MKRLGFHGAIMLSACLFFTVVCSVVAAEEDDYKRQSAKPWPIPRFIANNNGTVTDKLSGLIWLKDAACFGAQDWDTAVSLPATLGNGQTASPRPGSWT